MADQQGETSVKNMIFPHGLNNFSFGLVETVY